MSPGCLAISLDDLSCFCASLRDQPTIQRIEIRQQQDGDVALYTLVEWKKLASRRGCPFHYEGGEICAISTFYSFKNLQIFFRAIKEKSNSSSIEDST